MQALRGHVSGLCVPHYLVDLPGGGGKVPLLPDYWRRREDRVVEVMNYEGRLFRYPDVSADAADGRPAGGHRR